MSEQFDKIAKVLDAEIDAPVPPAGDVEVLGYIVAGSLLANTRERAEGLSQGGKYNIVEVVDRAHVTRLQAEIKDLLHNSVNLEVFEIVCKERDSLKADVETMRRKNNELNDTVAAQQSELTKAREWQEVAVSFINSLRVPQNIDQAAWQVLQAARVIEGYERLAHQPMPAAKDEGDE